MQAHPYAQPAESLGQTKEARLKVLFAPGAFRVTEIEPIGASVL